MAGCLVQLIGAPFATVVDAISFGVRAISRGQGVIPDRVLGRVIATLEAFSHGIAYPLGALLAAALAGWIGVCVGIAIGWASMAVSILLLLLSPLPRVRQPSDAAILDG